MTARADDPRLQLSSLATVRRAAACRDRDQFEWERWDGHELLRAAVAHIDALAAENAELRARAERAEAECVSANIAHHEALVDRDKLFDEAYEIRQERDQARHEAKLARLDADHHKAMQERLESFPLQRCYDALARRLLSLRAEAERVAAGETDGQALARLVLEATET